MTWYTFGTQAVYDPIADKAEENATGGKLVLIKDGPPIPLRDLNGSDIAEITSNASAMSSQFQAEVLTGLMQFGEGDDAVLVTMWANEVAELAASGEEALALIQELRAEFDAYREENPGGSGGGIGGGTLTGRMYRYITIVENTDGSYPPKPTNMDAQERIEWLGRNDPVALGIAVGGDKHAKQPST